MGFMTPLALFGFIPLTLVMFSMLRPRTAVLATFLIAVLFLPNFAYKAAILPAYGKATAGAYMALIGTLFFHPQLLINLRPRWVDIVPVAWTLWQVVPSVASGAGLYDGTAMALNHFLVWTIPFLIGRIYFTRAEHVREVAIALVVGGLVYLLPCAFEIKYSPQLHAMVYGFYISSFAETYRMEGFRPIIFMSHGLMLGMWMCMTALTALWLWWNERRLRVLRLPIRTAAIMLVVVSIFCRSTGAIGLMVVGISILVVTFRFRTKLALIALIAITPSYIFLRYNNLWNPQVIGSLASAVTGDSGREGSLSVRTEQEEQVVQEMHQHPITGSGHWGSGQDQLWLILGRNTGLPGLALWITFFSCPLALTMTRAAWRSAPVRTYGIPIGCVCVLHVVDGLFNGMYNPMYVLSAGAVAGCCLQAATVTGTQGNAARATRQKSGVRRQNGPGGPTGGPSTDRNPPEGPRPRNPFGPTPPRPAIT